MLPKSKKLNLKLLSTRDVYTSGVFFKSKFFSGNFDFNGGESKFSVVVPKKIIPLAVNRNTWKRFFYQNISQELLDLKSLRLIIKLKIRKKINSDLKKNIEQELSEMTKFIIQRKNNE